MNTPFSSHAWRELQSRAVSQLRPDFTDHVLRTARLGVAEHSPFAAWMASPITVSSVTAAICLLVVVFVHTHITNAASERHLADWREISVQTASLDLSP